MGLGGQNKNNINNNYDDDVEHILYSPGTIALWTEDREICYALQHHDIEPLIVVQCHANNRLALGMLDTNPYYSHVSFVFSRAAAAPIESENRKEKRKVG